MLTDPERCQVVLVTLPEATPVNELVETQALLVERVGVRLGPIVVNQVDRCEPLPEPDQIDFGRARAQIDDALAALAFRSTHLAVQTTEIERLAERVALPQIHLSARPVAGLSPTDIDHLAAELTT